MMRITLDGQRLSFTTNIFILSKQWDGRKQRIRGYVNEVKQYNSLLSTYANRAWEMFAKTCKNGDPIDLRLLRDFVVGKNTEVVTLKQAILSHIGQLNARKGIDVSPNTIKKYDTLLRKIEVFLQSRHQSDLPLSSLKRTFVEDLDTFLRKEQKLSQNGVAKNMQQLKRIIRVSIERQWIDKDPFSGYRCTIRTTDREYLNDIELSKLVRYSFTSDTLWRKPG